MPLPPYRDLETESPERRAERTFRAALDVLRHGWTAGGEVRARLERAGLTPDDIRTPDDWGRIPPLRKRELISLQAEHGLSWLLGCDIGRLTRIYQSPGPIFDPEGPGPDHWGWAEAFFAAGFRAGDLVQMTFSYHLTPAGLMLEEPLREIGCCVIPAGPGNTAVQIELMRRLPVTGFVGMASYLRIIGQKARAAGIDLRRDIRLRTAFVAAEKLSESLRREVQDLFDCTVRQGYGTADSGCLAYECDELSGMHVSSRALLEICDPTTGAPLPPGRVGEVVVTPFGREYPLVRLATGDLSRLNVSPCACGRTAPRLEGILGRADDTAKVKGQFIYPAQAAGVMIRFPQIEAWQLVVTNPGGRDTLTCRLAVKGELDHGAFGSAFQEIMKLRPVVVRVAAIGPEAPKLVDERTFD